MRCVYRGFSAWMALDAAAFIAAAAKHLPHSDVWCILYPSLRHFLRSDVRLIDEHNLLTVVKPPVRSSSSLGCLALIYDLAGKTDFRCRCAVGYARREESFLEGW